MSGTLIKIKIYDCKIYKTVILPVDSNGCGTWPLTLREEHKWTSIYLNVKMYKTVILPVGLYNYETRSLILKEKDITRENTIISIKSYSCGKVTYTYGHSVIKLYHSSGSMIHFN